MTEDELYKRFDIMCKRNAIRDVKDKIRRLEGDRNIPVEMIVDGEGRLVILDNKGNLWRRQDCWEQINIPQPQESEGYSDSLAEAKKELEEINGN